MEHFSDEEIRVIAKHKDRRTREKGPTLEGLFTRFVLDVVRIAMKQLENEQEGQFVASGLLDRKGAADYLAISPASLDHLRNLGEITPVILGDGKWPKWPRKELDRYIDSLIERHKR